MIAKLIRDCLTCADNETFDQTRVLSVMSFFSYYGLSFMSAWLNHPWSAMDFSGGIAAMTVAFGINLRLKHRTEPKKPS